MERLKACVEGGFFSSILAMNQGNVPVVAALFGLAGEDLRKHARWIFWEGILFVAFGFFAVILPALATIAVDMLVGWFLLVGGILQLLRCSGARKSADFWVTVVVAGLAIFTGFLLLMDPLRGAIALTLVVAIFLVVTGVLKLVLAVQLRGVRNSMWIGLDGIVSLALAFLIYLGWPDTGLWVLGVYVGVEFLFLGNALIFLSIGLKQGSEAAGPGDGTSSAPAAP